MGDPKELSTDADELQKFDELERNFHKVIENLSSDRGMDRFRDEYEKLHAALVASHEANGALIDKCRNLNNEVLANATKVSSALQFSHDAQREIGGLRHEFDRAWKLVEASQERDNKTKDVIENLKGEISTLSHLIEQGGAAALTQEASLHEMINQNAMLKKEILVQERELEQLGVESRDAKAGLDEMTESFAQLSKAQADVSALLQKERDHAVEASESVERCHQDIADTKEHHQLAVDQYHLNITEIATKKTHIDRLSYQQRVEDHNLKSLVEDTRTNQQSLKTKQKIYDDRMAKNAVLIEERGKYDERFAARDMWKANLHVELRAMNSTVEKTQAVLADAKEEKVAVNAEKMETKQQLQKCNTDFKFLAVASAGKELLVQADRRALEFGRVEYHDVSSKKGAEVAELHVMEGQIGILTNQTLGMKISQHHQRQTIERLNNEMEELGRRASGSRSNRILIEQETQIHRDEIAKLESDLSTLEGKIRNQVARLETIQNERDLACRQAEIAIAENAQLTLVNGDLSLDIGRWKGDIRAKDEQCLEIHARQRAVSAENVQLAKSCHDLRLAIRHTDDLSTQYRNKIHRSFHMLSKAELDIMKQKQVVRDVGSGQLTLTNEVTKRTQKIAILKEKAGTVTGLMKMAGIGYVRQATEVEEMKLQLVREVSRQAELMMRGHHRRALILEEIRFQKDLLLERGKVKALEEQLETPMNVHRWRFLEAVDPERAQLLKMNHELRERLMVRITMLARLRNRLKVLEKQAASLDHHLTNGYNGPIQEEFDYLTDSLRQKSKQLYALTERVNGQTGTVLDQKDGVLAMRTMLREEKSDYFDAKKKVDEIRASTATGGRRPNYVIDENIANDQTFIGGGFGVGGTIKAIREQPEIALTAAPLSAMGKRADGTAPRVVEPRCVSVMQKRRPRGWSPNRAPLQPKLPTAKVDTRKY